jgi:hypothetical protein
VLSHAILSQNFKFLIPSVFGNKTPLLKIKNSMLGIKIHSHPNKKPRAWKIKKSMLRIKNHLHPNKKPCARVKNPMLRIKKPC